MHNVKRFTRGLSSQVFKFSIFFVALAAATVTVFGNPIHLKQSLKESGIYENAVASVIDQAKKEQQNTQPDTEKSVIPIDDPAIQLAIKNALPAGFLENTTSQAITGIFAWLQGEADTPKFTIDLTQAKQKLATGIADAAYTKTSALPVCTNAQLQAIDPASIDIFSLECVPPNVNLAAERDKLASSIQNGGEFLEDTTISSDDLFNQDGNNVLDQYRAVPTIYQWLTRVPWILAGLAILCSAGLVYLHDERRRGLHVVARALLFAGLSLLFIVLVSRFMTGKLGSQATDSMQRTLTDLARTLSNQTTAVLLKFSIGYIIVGGGALIALRLTRQNTPDTPDAPPASPDNQNIPTTSNPNTPTGPPNNT